MSRAPQHLSASSRRFWSFVRRNWRLEPHHERLLTHACEAWDRAEEARETVAREGATYTDRFGAPRMHPAIRIEKDGREQHARLLQALGLEDLGSTDAVSRLSGGVS